MNFLLKNFFKNLAIVVLIFVILGAIFSLFSPSEVSLGEIPLSKLAVCILYPAFVGDV